MVGPTPGRYGPRRIREEIFLAHVPFVGKESGRSGRRTVHHDFGRRGSGLRARVPRCDAAVRVAGTGIEAGSYTSCIRRHYKTTGFAPRVPYSASSPSRLEPPPLVALASCIRAATLDWLASVSPPPSSSCSRRSHRWAHTHLSSRCFNGAVG